MLKRIATLACVITLCASVFAQQSMKKQSTAGMIGTDVDDFMDVTGFRGVKADKVFTYMGYNGSFKDQNGFAVGVAHQFKNLYLGVNFAGNLSGWQSTSQTTNGKTTSGLKSTDKNGFKVDALLGFEKFGLKTEVRYVPTSINNSSSDGISTYNTNYLIAPLVTAGWSSEKNKNAFDNYVALGFTTNVAVQSSDNKLISDTSYTNLIVNGGTAITFEPKDNITQKLYLDAETTWKFFTITETPGVKTEGRVDNRLKFTPAYSFQYKTERVTAKLKAGIPVDFNFFSTASKVGGTEQTQTNTFDLIFTPTLNAGVSYAVKPGKVDLNAGVSMEMFQFGWRFGIIKVPANSKSNTNFADFQINDTNGGSIRWTSGFTCYFGKHFTLDANYNILNNLLNNFSTNLTEGDGTSIFNTLNKVLVHNFSFIVTYKL